MENTHNTTISSPESSAPTETPASPEPPVLPAPENSAPPESSASVPPTPKNTIPPRIPYGTWPVNSGVSSETTPPPPQTPVWQTAPVPRPRVLNAYEQQLKSAFTLYGTCCLLIGILSAFCFYRNPNAITYPLFIAAIYLAAFRLLPSLGLPIKKDSLFLAAAALVLAVNTAATASPILHALNTLAQILLGSIFLIHQRYSDGKWNIEKYLTSIVLLWFQALASLPVPFSYTIAAFKTMKHGRSRNVLMLLGGCLAGIPAVVYLGCILSDADAVFQRLIEDVILNIFNPSTLLAIALIIVFTTLTACCLLGSVCSAGIPELKEPKRHNPLPAISFTAMIALLYLVFCGIQIVYLFAGKGQLPKDMTYAEYAHQGFFQLLAVAVMNLVFVLNCFKYFHKHRVLIFLLTLISLCTYVMIASAAYRMLLYVGAYYLTFLRFIVLWFLGVLAILMLGVLAMIFMPHFPLFRFSLAVITLSYCGFAWCIPDLQIARYNIARENGIITLDNAVYFAENLSADAAPAIAQAQLSPDITYSELYYYTSKPEFQAAVDKAILISSLEGIPWHFYRPDASRLSTLDDQLQQNTDTAAKWYPGIRKYNFSEARAKKLIQSINSSVQ